MSSLPGELVKVSGHVWFEIKVPKRRATKNRSVDDRAPHDRVMNQIQRAKGRRINNDQDEHRNHEMTRPRFLPSKSVSDERHKDSDNGDERRGDVQPFRARDVFTTHDVRPNVENREQDRQVHPNGSQNCKPSQDSNQEWLLRVRHCKRTSRACGKLRLPKESENYKNGYGSDD